MESTIQNLSDNLNSCPKDDCDGFLLIESCGMEADCETMVAVMFCEECNLEVIHKAKYDYSKY